MRLQADQRLKQNRADLPVQEAEAIRKDFNILFIRQDTKLILCLRTLQGHSGRNPIDPLLQDNVLIPNNFFEYIHHVGCAVSVHSITNSGLIPGGQNLSKERQTVFFTAVNPINKEHNDPHEIDLNAPRLAWYKQKVEKTSRRVLGRYTACSTEYLRLQADQRLKQNREDLPVLAHLQGLYMFSKDNGLTLNQELTSIKRTQLQKE